MFLLVVEKLLQVPAQFFNPL